ncbi:hypothetical protein SAMN06264348_104267 [Oceanospirillum linum]|nr:hypothetical protein SAMN04489856_1135 [Oleiphilus messinensis]SMP22655.1 hypothetical protein SAMN06264348_104267 [Oceanospirillum linum]
MKFKCHLLALSLLGALLVASCVKCRTLRFMPVVLCWIVENPH